jgi:hypothetical protein
MTSGPHPQTQGLARESTVRKPLKAFPHGEPFPGFEDELEKLQQRLAGFGLAPGRDTVVPEPKSVVPTPIPQPRFVADDRPGLVDTVKLMSASLLGAKLPLEGTGLTGALSGIQQVIPKIEPSIAVTEASRALAELENQARGQAQTDIEEVRSIHWRQVILAELADSVRTGEVPAISDLLALYTNENLSQEDVDFVGKMINNADIAISTPDRIELSIEDRKKQIKAVNSKSISTYALLVSGEQSLLGLARKLSVGEPVGMTDEEFSSSLVEAGFESSTPDEQALEFAKSRQEAWASENTRLDLLKSDFATLEIAKLSKMIQAGKMRAMLERPGLALALPIDYWLSRVTRPIVGAISHAISAPSDPTQNLFFQITDAMTGFVTAPARYVLGQSEEDYQEFELLFEGAREAGTSRWAASGYAWENSHTNGFKKFIAEVALDPLSWFGFGIYAKIVKPIPYVGRPLAGVEEHFMRFMDATFLGIKAGLHKAGRKTINIMVNETSKASMMVFRAAAEQSYATKGQLVAFKNLTPKQVRDFGRAAAKFSIKNPVDLSPFGRAGKVLTDRAPITPKEARTLAARVKGTFDDLMAKGDGLAQVDAIIGHTRGLGGKVLSTDESATLLLQLFQAPKTKASQKAMVISLKNMDEAVQSNVERMLRPSTTKEMWSLIVKNTSDVVMAQQTAAVRASLSRMGALTSPLTLMNNLGKLGAIQWMNTVSHGVARMYLMFAFYTPMNLIETGMKTVLAGLNPVYRGNPILEWLADSAGLRRTLNIFDDAAGITLQLGPVEFAGKVVPAKLSMLSHNAYRRIVRSGTDSWGERASGLVDEVFIKSGARMGLRMQANFLKRAMYRDLWERHPLVMKAIADESTNKQAIQELVDAGFDKKVIRDLHNAAADAASINLHNLTTLSQQYSRATLDANHLVEILSRNDQMTPVMSDWFMQEALGGRVLPRLDDFISQLKEIARQEVLNKPQLVQQQLGQMIDGLLANPPKTLDEYLVHVRQLQELTELVTNTVDVNLVQAQQYGTRLIDPQQKDAMYEEVWNRVLIPFMEDAEERIGQYAAVLKTQSGLSGGKAAEFEALITENLKHYELMRATREAQHEIEERLLPKKPGRDAPKAEHDAWWLEFYSERTALWEKARLQLIESEAAILSLGEDVGAVTLPKPFSVFNRELAPIDVSRLYNSIPQDLQSGLYMAELGAVRSRDEWVARVYKRAKRVAKQDKLEPEALGFSKERLGSVYDRMTEQMKGSTPVSDLMKPTMDQIDAMRIDLEAYAMKRNALFPEGGSEAIDKYGMRVKEALEANSDSQILSRDILVDEEGALLETFLPRAEQDRLEDWVQRGVGLDRRNLQSQLDRGQISQQTFHTRLKAKETVLRSIVGKPKASYDPSMKGVMEGSEIEWEANLKRIADSSFDPGVDLNLQGLLDDDIRLLESQAAVDRYLLNLRSTLDRMPDLGYDTTAIEEALEVVQRDFSRGAGATTAELEISQDALVAELKLLAGSGSPIRNAVESWFANSNNTSLQTLGGLAAKNPQYLGLIREVLKQRYPTGFIRVHRGGGSAKYHGDDPLAREFTNVTADRKTAEHFQATNDVWDKITPDIDSVVIRIDDVVSIGSAQESELIIPSKILRERMDTPLAIPKPWQDERQVALDRAENLYRLEFPDYDNMTAVNTAMRSVFPFWTYEAHRPFWIAKTFTSKPGVWAGWAKFQDHTDFGYIHIPGTSLEINPLRGTIWSGGLSQLVRRDYPEYYDQFPGVSNAVDWSQRFGFYPNIFVNAAFSEFGAKVGGSQRGELIPPLLATPLEALIFALPNSGVARTIQKHILPNRFRDFLTSRAVGRQGNDGAAILNKKWADIPLTSDEQLQWQSGQKELAGFNFWNIHVAMARMKPEELLEFQAAARELIFETTGIPVDTQEQMTRVGLRISDFISLPFELRQAIDDLEGAARWRGSTVVLQESELGSAMAMVRQFFVEVEDIRDNRQAEKEDLDRRAKLPSTDPEHITMKTWEKLGRDLASKVHNDTEALRNSARYQYEFNGKIWKVPLSLDERKAWADERGLDPLTLHPEDELMALYFEKEVEIKDGILDWRGLYRWRRDIEEVLPDTMREHLLNRIRRHNTPLDTARRQDYEFSEQYFGARDYVLSTRSAKDQAIIAEFTSTSDPAVREALRAEIGDQGVPVVSGFQGELAKFRTQLRRMNPELDARMVVWGISGVQTPITDVAKRRVQEIRHEYGFR